MAGIQQIDNEITRFVDARYVSASEACWRIFHYDLHDRSPSIQRLAVHLPGQQQIIYKEGSAQTALERLKHTTLTAWFEINKHLSEARHVLYHMFPEHFTWNSTSAQWSPRKSGHSIGRLYQAHPGEGERFYLRTLLHHTPGATCFEDLRRLPTGEICDTFKEAALHRGLLQDDNEWDFYLQEAASSGSPSQIRSLFATILLFCEPSNHSCCGKNSRVVCQTILYSN